MSGRFFSIKWKLVIPVTIGSLVLGIIFSIIYISDIRNSSERAIIEKSRAILLNTEAVREEMEHKWELGLFSVEQLKRLGEEDKQLEILAAVPVYSSWRSAMVKAEEGGYDFRVPKIQARNPRNTPDAAELAVLEKLKSENLKEYYEFDEELNAIRYYRPVILGESCLICHGDPASSSQLWGNDRGEDPTGNIMENWKAGEVHGAFEVISSLEEVDMRTNQAVLKVLLVIGGALIVIILALYYIISAPIRTMQNCAELAGKIERGFLNMDISEEGANDEAGQILQSFKKMKEQLAFISQSIIIGSQQIAAASNELSIGNIDLSSRTEQQATALEETSAAIEEMNASIRSNSENTGTARQLSEDALSKTGEGTEAVVSMISSMNDISDSSHRIADIIEVINGIAFQTNLLALNASIEAARAGIHGKGFAVVAVEVRKLAKKSDKAAAEIVEIIKTSNEKVRVGVRTAEQTEKALHEVSTAVSKVTSLVKEISEASNEQLSTVNQIDSTLATLDENTQRNAALVEEAAASTEELSGQAEDLKKNISFFKVG